MLHRAAGARVTPWESAGFGRTIRKRRFAHPRKINALNYTGNVGCPARIRTSIDGVRVRSLTFRRRGNSGGASKPGPGCGQGAGAGFGIPIVRPPSPSATPPCRIRLRPVASAPSTCGFCGHNHKKVYQLWRITLRRSSAGMWRQKRAAAQREGKSERQSLPKPVRNPGHPAKPRRHRRILRRDGTWRQMGFHPSAKLTRPSIWAQTIAAYSLPGLRVRTSPSSMHSAGL